MRQASRWRGRFIVREAGTALAVIAVYILVLLLPLHQAAGLQRDLSALGYETVGAWSICQQAAPDRNDQAPTAVKCPAAGATKHHLAAVIPPAILIREPIEARCPHPSLPASGTPEAGSDGNPRQTRAPPVQS